jgi:prepilin-type N-terminal cleavage/methylation domain-containing protein
MKTRLKNEGAVLKNQSGFTLIEMLIVVIVLGILAMIIIPQISISTDDAKLKTLQTNLNTMRNTIELYYHQHNQQYPGAVDESDGDGPPTDAATAFIAQLTTYTKASGETSVSKTGDFIYGPYIKTATLPKNPFTETNDLACDIATTDVTTRTALIAKAWRFYVITGVFIADDHVDHDDY